MFGIKRNSYVEKRKAVVSFCTIEVYYPKLLFS